MTGISRKTAEAIRADIAEHFREGREDLGPNLRAHDHEELPEGCWSIDWEGGPEDWAIRYADKVRRTDILLEPIYSFILGLYPR